MTIEQATNQDFSNYFETSKRDSILTAEQYRGLEKEAIWAARRSRIARTAFGSIINYPFGKTQYAFDKYAEMSDAIVSMTFENTYDLPLPTRTTLEIPIVQQGFQIERRQYLGSKTDGTPIDASAISSAGYKVGQEEELLLFMGWTPDGTTYEWNGLYNAAGNDYSTSADFATAGKPIAAVGGAIALLEEDAISAPYNLYLATTQWGQMIASFHTGGIYEMTELKAMLGGEIYHAPELTAGTGMVVQKNSPHLKLVLTQDITTETWDTENKDGIRGRVFEALVPAVYDSNAICKLSSI